MKKIYFLIVFVFTMGLCVSANNDGFFSNWECDNGDRGNDIPSLAMPNTEIGDFANASAPLGSGVMVLTALGAAYTLKKSFFSKK